MLPSQLSSIWLAVRHTTRVIVLPLGVDDVQDASQNDLFGCCVASRKGKDIESAHETARTLADELERRASGVMQPLEISDLPLDFFAPMSPVQSPTKNPTLPRPWLIDSSLVEPRSPVADPTSPGSIASPGGWILESPVRASDLVAVNELADEAAQSPEPSPQTAQRAYLREHEADLDLPDDDDDDDVRLSSSTSMVQAHALTAASVGAEACSPETISASRKRRWLPAQLAARWASAAAQKKLKRELHEREMEFTAEHGRRPCTKEEWGDQWRAYVKYHAASASAKSSRKKLPRPHPHNAGSSAYPVVGVAIAKGEQAPHYDTWGEIGAALTDRMAAASADSLSDLARAAAGLASAPSAGWVLSVDASFDIAARPLDTPAAHREAGPSHRRQASPNAAEVERWSTEVRRIERARRNTRGSRGGTSHTGKSEGEVTAHAPSARLPSRAQTRARTLLQKNSRGRSPRVRSTRGALRGVWL